MCWRAFVCRVRTLSFTFVRFLWVTYLGAVRDLHAPVVFFTVFTAIFRDIAWIVACRTPLENAGATESVTSISGSYSVHLLEILAFFRDHLSQKRGESEHSVFDSPVFLSCTLFFKSTILLTKDSQRDQQRSSDRRCFACFVCLHREYMSQPNG